MAPRRDVEDDAERAWGTAGVSTAFLVVSPNRLSSRERRRVSTAIGGVAEQVWYEWLLAFRARTKPVPQSSDVQVVLPLPSVR